MASILMWASPWRCAAIVLGAVWLVGCALVPIQSGATRAEVLANYGMPMLFWVYLNAGNVVQRTGQGFELTLRGND